jgi:TonB family protein
MRAERGVVVMLLLFASRGTLASSLDREEISRVIRSHRAEVRRCYESGLQRRPGLAGRLVVEFTLRQDGSVSRAEIRKSDLGDPEVEACIAARALTWKFPPVAPVEDSASFSYPFVFKR